MPRKQYPPHPVRDALITKVREHLDKNLGKPKNAQILEMMKQLPALYPELQMLHDRAKTFSKSALSDTLNCQRQGLPDRVGLACIILAAQQVAVQTGSIETDPGAGVLGYWYHLLSEAEHQSERLGLPVRPDHRTTTAQPGDQPAAQPSAPGTFFTGPPPVSPEVGREVERSPSSGPAGLSPAGRDYLATRGGYGQDLLRWAAVRDPEALYQAAVLLTGDPTRSHAVLSLLHDAAATGHSQSLALLDASPRDLDRDLVAAHARRLGDLAQQTENLEAAVIFYRCFLDITAATSDTIGP